MAGSAQRVGVAAQPELHGDRGVGRSGQAEAVKRGERERDDLGYGDKRAGIAGRDCLLRGAAGEAGVGDAAGQHQRCEDAEDDLHQRGGGLVFAGHGASVEVTLLGGDGIIR
jgi:hypothetical protein